MTFDAKAGTQDAMAGFLRGAAIVDEEPETTAWFAIHLDSGRYGILMSSPTTTDGSGT
jgi:hypothetical protein